jgi:hypothetical protein
MRKIPKQTIPNIDETEYWKVKSERESLPSMKSRCDDCAIATGFYTPYADNLLKQPIDVQHKVVQSWFCHNHANRSCKGAEEYVIHGIR